MPTRFERLVTILLDNVFDITTIVVAGVLVIRYQITPPVQSDIPEIITWVLAVLGLMTISGIWERNRRLTRIEKIAKETREFAMQYVGGVVPASRFFIQKKLHHLPEETFSSSQTIDLSGMVLSRTIREYMGILQERLRMGASLRIMICDPTNTEVVNQIALRVEGNFPPSRWKENIEGVEMYIREIAKIPHKRGAIKLGFLPYLPAFGQINLNAHKPNGICLVEIYHHKSPDYGPAFEVLKANDATWHQFFVQEYEILWASCRIEML